MRLLLLNLLIGTTLPAMLAGQSLEQRVAAVGNGTARLSFAARPGVCGSVNGISLHRSSDEWENDCGPQEVRVALRVMAGRVVEVRSYVGGRWREGMRATDLGAASPGEAAAYLIRLAEREPELQGDPVLPAALADSITIWPSLLKLARSPTAHTEARRTAVFWLGQAAGAVAAQALDSIADDPHGDREVRKQAVFALSQRDRNEGVPALIRVARTNPDPELRKSALFWLGQSEDPRALALFEEILK
jgi:hypothetical protein